MTRESDLESRKRRILDAALEIVESDGVEGVTLKRVAGKAKVSKSTILKCFAGKEELLRESGDRYWRQYRERLGGLQEAHPDDPEKTMDLLIRNLAQAAQERNPQAVRLSRLLYATRVAPTRKSGKVAGEYRQIMEPLIRALESTIDRGAQLGKFQPVTERNGLAFIVYASLRGIALAALLPDLEGRTAELQAFFRGRIFEILGIRPQECGESSDA